MTDDKPGINKSINPHVDGNGRKMYPEPASRPVEGELVIY
jgi:hypothetical protein